jgi:Outer membrane receptor for ferrienterochelin and colicins
MSHRSTTALASGALAAALLAASTPVSAQSATELPPVPVDLAPAEDGISKPLSGGVLTRDDLAAKVPATSDTARLLLDVPGVNVTTGGGASSLPTMRGLADDRLKILVDGMPITAACPNHMNPALSYLDPTNVGRIEVLPGITPVSAGGDSIGGTIAVDSADPVFAAEGQDLLTTGKLSATYRSNNHAIALSGDVTAATKTVSLGYAGSFTHAGDYHRGGDNAPVQASKYQIENHALTVAARHDTDLIVLQGGWQFSPYQGFPNQRMDMTENLSKFANGRYAGQFRWGTLDANAYWRGVKHEMDFLDKVKSAGTMPMNTDSDEVGYGVKGEIPLSSRDTLRVGNEFQRHTLDDWWPPVPGMAPGMGPNDFWNIRDGERNRVGTFAEWERQWTPQWSTLLGGRNDTVWMDTDDVQGYSGNYAADAARFNAQDHAKTDVNFDLTALARFEPDKASAFEAGYARKTRSPSLYERYTWASTSNMAASMNNWYGDGNGYVGDVNLEPEVAHTVSVSGDWHDPARKTWGIKVTPYYTYVQDYIDADDIGAMTNGFRKFRLANHDARIYGVDLSGNLEMWDNLEYGRGVFKASLGWLKGKNLDSGDNLYNIMPLNARLAVEHRLGGWSNGVELQVVDGKDDVAAARNENSTPAYALVNLRTGYEWSNLAVNLAVENVFDQMYHEPLGGADLAMRTKVAGSNVYGMGRSFIAGLTVKF